MGKEEITEKKVRDRLTARGGTWATGDGATTEFSLPRAISNASQILVFVGGALKRPDEVGTVHDYKVRGLSAGYEGVADRIKFTAAPGGGVAVLTQVIG